MTKFLLKRLGMMLLTLFLITLLTFILMHSVPGGPFTGEKQVSKAVMDALNEKYKLNDPLWKQFFDYVGGLLRADGRVIAYTMGEALNDEVFCVHFEKAFPDIRGAYPAINQMFVQQELQTFRFINREDDVDIEKFQISSNFR